eukprot:2441466-Amphidinium_carterae.1
MTLISAERANGEGPDVCVNRRAMCNAPLARINTHQAPHAQQSINASASRATIDQCKRHTRSNDTPQAPQAQQHTIKTAPHTQQRTHHAATPSFFLMMRIQTPA